VPKTIAFIPIRSGSKSIPNKNIRVFNGKPLVHWSIEAALNCELIDRVVIASDYEKKDIGYSNDSPKIEYYQRDSTNAQDTSSTESVILEYLENSSHSENDLFVLIQATNPFFNSEDLKKALLSRSEGASMLSCSRIKRFFWNDDGTPLNYNYYKRPRRQDFRGILMENGAFYINTVKGVIKAKNRMSNPVEIYEMPEFAQFEIDEESDWIVAENLHQKYIPS